MPRAAVERQTHRLGDMRYISEAEGLGRVALRAENRHSFDLDVDQSLFIEQVLQRFEDVTVPAGCIAKGKVRWDRFHVHVFLIRRLSRVPPRHMASVLELSPRYLAYALDRGRKLLEAARRDGRLDDAMADLRRLQGDDDDP